MTDHEKYLKVRRELMRTAGALKAAISLLENTKDKSAAPSDKMWDQMIEDYKKRLGLAQKLLKEPI